MKNDFAMNTKKPVNNNGGLHCPGNYDDVFNGRRLTPHARWKPTEGMTKIHKNKAWRPGSRDEKG